MKPIDIYTAIVGTIALRFIVTDNTYYMISCFVLGVTLGISRGLSK